MTDEELEPIDEGNSPEEKIDEEIAEDVCDPITMTCDEIQKKVTTELIPRTVQLEKNLTELDNIRQSTPSEELDKAYEAIKEQKEKNESEIFGLFQKYTIC